MNDPVSVQVLAAKDHLPQIVASLGLRQCFPPFVQFQERLGGGGERKGRRRNGGSVLRSSGGGGNIR